MSLGMGRTGAVWTAAAAIVVLSREVGGPSENIRAARVRSGLEPDDVARAVGLNKTWYYDVEARDDEVTGNISMATLMAIARTLGTTAVELFDGPGTVGVPALEPSNMRLRRIWSPRGIGVEPQRRSGGAQTR